MLNANRISDQIWQITDTHGVGCTLLCGRDRALLIDTGYGVDYLPAYIASLTTKKVAVLLTHGHHDHALGCRGFDRVMAFPEEKPVYETYTSRQRRERVLASFGMSREAVPGYFDALPALSEIEDLEPDLGDLKLQILKVPGHTPGSAMIYIEKEKLLLTGDNWNPETWLFFPEAMPVSIYLQNMETVLSLPFEHMICPHREQIYPRNWLEAFLRGISEGHAWTAREFPDMPMVRPVEMQLPMGQKLVFDLAKAPEHWQ